MTPTSFWDKTKAQLAETSLDLSVERDSFYSQPEWEVYRLNYNTTDGHRLFAWLSVPKNVDGPVPALIRLPDYASVHDIIYTSLRHEAVVMNATHRGQRNSDGNYRASYPGLLTDGIADGESWSLLGAYADALRALDALLAQNLVEIGAIALWGVGLGGRAWRWRWRRVVPGSAPWRQTRPCRWDTPRRWKRGSDIRWAKSGIFCGRTPRGVQTWKVRWLCWIRWQTQQRWKCRPC